MIQQIVKFPAHFQILALFNSEVFIQSRVKIQQAGTLYYSTSLIPEVTHRRNGERRFIEPLFD